MFLRHTSASVPPGDDVLTLVPTNRLARYLRRASIAGSGFRAITPPLFHTLETFARSVYLATPAPWPELTGSARLLFFQEAIRASEGAAGYRVPRGTFAKMLAAVTTLEESGVTPDRFAEELRSLAPHERDRLEGFLRYFRAFQRECRRARVLGSTALLQHLHGELTQNEFEKAFRTAFPGVREVDMDGFDDFSDLEIAFVERLKSLPGLQVSVSLAFVPDNPALTGYIEKHARRFQAMGFAVVDAGPPATALATRLFKQRLNDGSLDLSKQVTVVEARTRWHEVTAICRLIKRIMTERPEKDLSRICVALPKPGTYTDIIRERFAAYGIPSNITDRFELSRSPLIIDIMGLLEMRRLDFQRDAVLRVLHSPLLSSENLVDRGNLIDISRRLRVTGGFALWIRKIDGEIRFKESRRQTIRDSAGEPENSALLEALRKARTDLLMLGDLTRDFEGDLTAGEFELRVIALLGRLNLPDRIAAPGPSGELQERDARAYAGFLEILHEAARTLKQLSATARHGLGYYTELLKSVISAERYNFSTWPERGVLVTDLEETRGLPVEVMIIGGMEDGSLPGQNEPQLFLSSPFQGERDRKRLQRSRYLFYRAASNWTEHLYITYPLRESGVDLVRSSFLDALFAAGLVPTVHDTDPTIAGDALYSEDEFLEWYAGQEREMDEGKEGVPQELREKALRLRRSRRIEQSRTLTHEMREFEGMIGGALSSRAASFVRNLGAYPFSVSDLETYGACPFKFLARELLRLHSPAEFLEEISSTERGFILHDVLFEFYRDRQARGLPAPRELSDEAFDDAVRELEGIAERRLSSMEIPGPFWEMERDLILGRPGPEPGLLHLFLLTERKRTDGMLPAFFEVAFGQPGSRPAETDGRLSTPAPVKIGDLNLRGRIDRLDVGDDSFTVIDYKTGNSVPTFADIRSGASLQLPLYLRAAEELLSRAGSPLAPAAGLYYRLREPVELQLALGSARYSGVAFNAPRTSRRVLKTQAELEAITDAAVRRANEYVDAMRRGEFPLATPELRETVCRYCEFKTICRVTTVQREREEGGGVRTTS